MDDSDMPQPLSRVSSTAQIYDGFGEGENLPSMLHSIVTVISTWSKIDSKLAGMLSGFLEADYTVAFAMYEAFSSADARRAALLAAAKVRSHDNYVLINATLNVIKSSQRKRNQFAHHIWGHSPELPDKLLLMDPLALAKQTFEMRDAAAKGLLTPISQKVGKATKLTFPPHPVIDRDKISVWDELGLAGEAECAFKCDTMVKLLSRTTSVKYPDDPARRTLLGEPAIARAIERLNQ